MLRGAQRATSGRALSIPNARGHLVGAIRGGGINGPWDMTAVHQGDRAGLFVTDVLNGTVAGHRQDVQRGTVVRISLRIRRGHVRVVTRTE